MMDATDHNNKKKLRLLRRKGDFLLTPFTPGSKNVKLADLKGDTLFLGYIVSIVHGDEDALPWFKTVVVPSKRLGPNGFNLVHSAVAWIESKIRHWQSTDTSCFQRTKEEVSNGNGKSLFRFGSLRQHLLKSSPRKHDVDVIAAAATNIVIALQSSGFLVPSPS
uniref:Uncharacterized protein n=1 Tax=Lotharella globosa TaxID=91324 RepID=A0A7S4DNN4_9EUKA